MILYILLAFYFMGMIATFIGTLVYHIFEPKIPYKHRIDLFCWEHPGPFLSSFLWFIVLPIVTLVVGVDLLKRKVNNWD